MLSFMLSSFQDEARLFQTSSLTPIKDSAESTPKRDKPLKINGKILEFKDNPFTIPQHAIEALCDVEQIKLESIFPPTASMPPE